MPAEIYLIGIAGPSGAGKSFWRSHLKAALEAKVLELDRYYHDLSHLPLEQRARVNFDAPEALEHELLIEQVARLRNREPVHLPVYDFTTHTRTAKTEILQPTEVIIVEGLFTLHWPGLRELLGTKVYVDLNDEICLTRRKARDVRERGRTPGIGGRAIHDHGRAHGATLRASHNRTCGCGGVGRRSASRTEWRGWWRIIASKSRPQLCTAPIMCKS